MADIFHEVDEDVRQERFDKIWKAYGKYLIGFVLAIVLGTAAFVGWQNYQKSQREDEGERFAAAFKLAQDGHDAEAANAFMRLAGDAGVGYRVLSNFQAAAALISTGDVVGAVAVYDRIAADAAADRMLRDLAALQAVRHLIDTAPGDELDRRLAPLLVNDGSWRHSARELDALVALKAGDSATAREVFTILADDLTAPPGIRARAAEMVAALGGSG